MTLEEFIVKIKSLDNTIEIALKDSVEAIDANVDTKFGEGKSPSGKKWAPRKDGASDNLLYKTGALRYSRKVYCSGIDKIRLIYYDKKAAYHQNGTSNMAARELVPSTLPKEWLEIIKDNIESRIERDF